MAMEKMSYRIYMTVGDGDVDGGGGGDGGGDDDGRCRRWRRPTPGRRRGRAVPTGGLSQNGPDRPGAIASPVMDAADLEPVTVMVAATVKHPPSATATSLTFLPLRTNGRGRAPHDGSVEKCARFGHAPDVCSAASFFLPSFVAPHPAGREAVDEKRSAEWEINTSRICCISYLLASAGCMV
eukprot:gene15266-biopygen3663